MPLMCINQKILLLPGKLQCEGIDYVSPAIFDFSTVYSSMIDVFGNRLNRWTSLAMLSL